MPLGEEAAVVVVEAALELAVKAAKGPLEKITHRWLGKKVLILGPRNTGKSSFAKYMRYGILADEEVRILSEDEEVFSTFSVETAKGQRLSVRFKHITALPGELHIPKQAQLVKKYKPQLCLIILDIEGIQSSGQNQADLMVEWFEKFAHMLIQTFSSAKESTRRKIRLLIVLNKSDKVGASVIRLARKKIAQSVERILVQGFSNHLRETSILPCCLIDSADCSKQRDAVVRQMLADLQ